MAVAIARRVDVEKAGTHQLLLDTLPHPAFANRKNMSQQFPHAPVIPRDLGATASPNFSIPSDQTLLPQGSEPSIKKRKSSKVKPHSDLKRSQSTPHIRGLAMSETTPISPTIDKRRNKLGYHRTSVACGHCRKRKIRCLLPIPEDPQGRCSNCIRLKKECNFYPVTESSQHEVRSSSASRKSTQTAPPSTSTPASPRTTGTSNQGSVDELRFPPANQEFLPSSQGESFAATQPNDAQFAQQGYGYSSFQSPEQWSAQGFLQNQGQVSSSQSESASASAYWSPAHQMESGSYQTSPSTAGGQVPATPFESPGFPYNQPQSTTTWGQPRSLSYGHIEGIQHHYAYHPLSNQQSPQVQSPAFPSYPHQLASNHPTAVSTEAGASAIQTPTTTHHIQSYPPIQPGWTTYQQPNPLASTHDPNTTVFQNPQWYSQQSPHTKQIEQFPGNASQYAQPPAYYSNVSHT